MLDALSLCWILGRIEHVSRRWILLFCYDLAHYYYYYYSQMKAFFYVNIFNVKKCHELNSRPCREASWLHRIELVFLLWIWLKKKKKLSTGPGSYSQEKDQGGCVRVCVCALSCEQWCVRVTCRLPKCRVVHETVEARRTVPKLLKINQFGAQIQRFWNP